MKATKLITTAAVATLGLTLLSPTVLAAKTPEQIAEAERAKTLTGKGKVTFEESNTKTDKGDPEEETIIDVPGVVNPDGGPLRVDFVSELDFGVQEIKLAGGVYNAAAAEDKTNNKIRGNFVQVTDSRGAGDDGVSKGWELKAKMSKQFETADKTSKIKGASISYLNPVVTYKEDKGSVQTPRPDVALDKAKYEANGAAILSVDENGNGNEETMLTAKKGNGLGTYYLQFGRNKDYSKQADDTTASSVKLTVPANLPLKQSEYTADITWTINELK